MIRFRNNLITIFTIIILILGTGGSTELYGQNPQRLGKVTSAAITEISGIVPYGFEEGYFWVHNDSGDGPNIYLIDSKASLKVRVEVEGLKAIDIEDIGRFQLNDKKYLLLADMGNNLRDREILSLYIIEEPKLNFNVSSIKVPLVKELKYRYSDKRRDAEALFVDPLDLQVYILSKRDFESTVFSFPIDLKSNQVNVLKPLQTLPFTFTTAADISSDGKYILAKNLTHIYFWERKNKESIIESFQSEPKIIPYQIEPQGEAICFDLKKRFFYTISERPFGLDSYLYRYDF